METAGTGLTTAAVTVTWRDCEMTLLALQSLSAMDPAPDLLVCIAQELDAVRLARLREEAPAGSLIVARNDNLGFAAAANLGFRTALEAGVDYTLLFNNDAIAEPLCLGRCVIEASGDERVAVVGPAIAIIGRPDRLWYGGGVHSRLFAYTRHRALGSRGTAAMPPPTSDTQYIPGCCALYSMRAWRELGEFREDFFMYYEDAEWGLRARSAGWRLRYLGEVLCHHAIGVSSDQTGSLGLGENTAYYLARNPLRFALETNGISLRASRVGGVMSIWNTYNAWRIVKSGRLAVAQAYLQGLRDGFGGRMGRRPT